VLGAPRGDRLATIRGSVPELVDLPRGCAFAGRCGLTIDACYTKKPPLAVKPGGHAVRCLRLDDIAAKGAVAA
jgi:peptide/nickel transport system ATP-binding protein